MKIFISWSGEISKRIASEVRSFISNIFEDKVSFFYSPDIRKGRFWPEELFGNMATCESAIICITPQNKTASWILFEAGAIASKMLDKERQLDTVVCPVYFGFHDVDLSGPLSSFQVTFFKRDDFWALTKSINESLGGTIEIGDTKLDDSFSYNWKSFRAKVNQILREHELPTDGRDRLAEIKHYCLKEKKSLSIFFFIGFVLLSAFVMGGVYNNHYSSKWGQVSAILKNLNMLDNYSDYISQEIAQIDPNSRMYELGFSTYDEEISRISIPCNRIEVGFTYQVNGSEYSSSEMGKENISYKQYTELLNDLDDPIDIYYEKQFPEKGYIYNPDSNERLFVLSVPWILIAILILGSVFNSKQKSNIKQK